MPEQIQPGWYRLLGKNYWILSFGSFIVGAVLYAAAELFNPFWKSVASGSASGFVALAVVTWGSEYILKTDMTRELLTFSRLDEALFNTGLMRLEEERNFTWQSEISGCNSVTALTIRPSDFVGRVWSHILENASSKGCDVEVILVDPASDAAREVASRRGETTEGYIDEILRAANSIEQSWDREKRKPNWPKKSSLTISLITAPPIHSHISIPGHNFVVIEPLVPISGSQSTLCAKFRDMNGARFPDQWMSNAISDAQSYTGTPKYTDKLRPTASRRS